jgi:hypothetical protein
MPIKGLSVRRAVVPGLTISPVKTPRAGKPVHVVIERAGATLHLNMATIPGFLSICSQMRQALRAPISLRDGAEFTCLIEDGSNAGYLRMHQLPGTDWVSIWRGSDEVLILDGWEIPALASALSALVEELEDSIRSR